MLKELTGSTHGGLTCLLKTSKSFGGEFLYIMESVGSHAPNFIEAGQIYWHAHITRTMLPVCFKESKALPWEKGRHGTF